MSLFGNKKKRKEAEVEINSQSDIINSPILIIRLVDGVHLDVAIEWPENCDIEIFTQVLTLLNSGKLIAPQLAAASIFASRLNQPEKAIMITKALDEVSNVKKNRTAVSDNSPIIPPSKFMHNLLKSHGH